MFPKLPASPEPRDLGPEGVMSPALSFRVLSVTSLPTWRQSTAQVSGMGHGELPLSAFVRARGRATGSQLPHHSLGSQLTHSLSCTSGVFNSSVPWVLCSVSLLLHLAPHSCALKVDSAQLASPQLMASLSGSPKTPGKESLPEPSAVACSQMARCAELSLSC